MPGLRLSFACEAHDRILPLTDGSVKPEGLDISYSRLPVADTFFRQLKNQEFDVSEMSISFYLMAKTMRGRSFPYLAIPVFPMRRFFHTEIQFREGSGIKKAQDLKGKRFAVPEFGMTMALWVRAVLRHEFGVNQGSMSWYVERTGGNSIGAALGFRPPAGVKVAVMKPEDTMASMFALGKLDAGVIYREQLRSSFERSTDSQLSGNPKVKLLFPDQKAESIRYFKKTGFFPINHTIVVREGLLKKHPWIARSLFTAFQKAKEVCYKRNNDYIARRPSFVWLDQLQREISEVFNGDPFPYGMRANRRILDAMIGYSLEQHLIHRKLELENLFFHGMIDT